MHRHFSAVCAAILPLTLTSVSAYAQPVLDTDCWNQDELSAVQVHNFKTMLMVGSIKCREIIPSTVDGYNAFVNNKRDFITSNQYVVVSHFIKKYGSDAGITSFRNYETSVGNIQSGGNFLSKCEAIGAISRLAASASDDDLRELARVITRDSLTPVCPAGHDNAVAASVAMAAAPLAGGTGNGVQEPSLTPPAPSGVPGGTAAAASPAVASMSSEPAPAAAAAVVAPAPVPEPAKLTQPAAPSAAQALQDAARALALAASALQTQSAVPAGATPADAVPAKAN